MRLGDGDIGNVAFVRGKYARKIPDRHAVDLGDKEQTFFVCYRLVYHLLCPATADIRLFHSAYRLAVGGFCGTYDRRDRHRSPSPRSG